MSAPAANAFSLPVSTMQPTPASSSNACSAVASSLARTSFNAFNRCGRLRRMMPTRSRVSTMMVSKVADMRSLWKLALLGVEVLAQALPAAKIFALQLRRFERETGRPDHVARFEHEGHRIRNARRLREVGRACLGERVRVGPVPRHAVVETRA